jgi:hypothetical protein
MALHVVTFFKSDDGPSAFDVGLLLWSWLPYTFCLACAFAFRNAWPVFLAGSLALAVDLVTFNDVFIHPTHSTAAIGLLFAPLVNLVVVPLGLLLGWGLSRLFRSQPAP